MHSSGALTKTEKGPIKLEAHIEESRLAIHQHLSGRIKYSFNKISKLRGAMAHLSLLHMYV